MSRTDQGHRTRSLVRGGGGGLTNGSAYYPPPPHSLCERKGKSTENDGDNTSCCSD